jgi:hypothetical protein
MAMAAGGGFNGHRDAVFRLGIGALLFGLSACGGGREVAIQKAKVGDLLVQAEGVRVELARTFRPGVSNGLYRGAVKVSGAGQGAGPTLHAMNAVCSAKDLPGWPTYDNLFGFAIGDVKQEQPSAGQDRWQVLYHFDGRVEGSGALKPQPWMARLKDNLCRRADFDDTAGRVARPQS